MTTRYRSSLDPLYYTHELQCQSYNLFTGNRTENVRKNMTDQLQPDYFSKVRSGEFLAIQPMSSEKQSLTCSSSLTEWSYENLVGGVWHSSAYASVQGNLCVPPRWLRGLGLRTGGFVYGGTLPEWPDESAVITEGLANARQAALDVSTFLAELNKTKDLIVGAKNRTLHRAEVVADAVEKKSRGRGRKSSRRLDLSVTAAAAFAETWLEGRYGWRILRFDLEAANEAITRLNSFKTPLRRGYAQSEASTGHAQFSANDEVLLHYSPTQTWSLSNFTRVNVYGNQSYTRQIRSGSIVQSFLNSAMSIDPIVTAWEVVPFSFIADWFVNIGDNFAAYSPFASGALYGTWVTTRETLNEATEATAVAAAGWDSPTKRCTITGTKVASLTSSRTLTERYSVDPNFGLRLRLNVDFSKLVDLGSIVFGRYANLLGKIRKSTRL